MHKGMEGVVKVLEREKEEKVEDEERGEEAPP